MIEAHLAKDHSIRRERRDTVSHMMVQAPSMSQKIPILKSVEFDTPLGLMVAIADEEFLHLLEFVDCRGLEREIERLRQKTRSSIIPGNSPSLNSIQNELDLYFSRKLIHFTTPLFCHGSPFQMKVWEELKKIPFGETRSYLEIAKKVGNPLACRAVARANASNQIAIVIPCHRVINNNGLMGGYAGGIARKEWLLHHEKIAN